MRRRLPLVYCTGEGSRRMTDRVGTFYLSPLCSVPG